MTNKYAIYVTVYKHRYEELLANLADIDNKFDIYIVAQQNDPNLSDYAQYVANDNIHILTPDVTSIFQKREFIRRYSIDNGYVGFFMIDDDVRYKAWSIRNANKRETSDTYPFYVCPFNEMLQAMIDCADQYNAGYVCNIRWGYIGWRKPNEVGVNSLINVAQFGYFVTDKVKDTPYDTSGEINEDTDMIIRLLQQGIYCCCVCDYMFDTIDKNSENTTIDNSEELVIGQTLKYHNNLYINKKGRIQARIQFKKYWNNYDIEPVKDKELYEICKTRDVEKVRQYLLNKNITDKRYKK